ncbi:MAG TPA: hypothetical protein PKM63_00145 [Panacibacter sp.]|nr:hypothetical protein [Panacibacter sp.]HNP42659.1 hypothetical protein [Panacibacter sp.]
MKKELNDRWLRISFLNLLIVALLGVILRYKIAFSLPFVDQKFLLHAHSHFAFSGWLTQILMAFIANYILSHDENASPKKFNILLWGNLISAYGMLFSFPFEGYGAVSIFFSTASIFNAYGFAVVAWKGLNKIVSKDSSHLWFKAALLFSAISSLGAFSLAFMMATKTINQDLYLAAVYFFLHFQYNGWFFFAGVGLLMLHLTKNNIAIALPTQKLIFWLFSLSLLPVYFLSALWLPVAKSLYPIIVVASFVEFTGFILLLKALRKNSGEILASLDKPVRWLWTMALIAFCIKVLLQMCSAIPSLNMITYGFRPIVIGYLHLVLLGMLSIFLTGYFLSVCRINYSGMLIKGLIIFVSGIILNELMLMLQGITGLTYVPVPYINEALLICALIMFTGLVMINKNIWSRTG